MTYRSKKGGLETDQGVVEFRLGSASDDRDGRTLVLAFNRDYTDDIESGGTEQILATGVASFVLSIGMSQMKNGMMIGWLMIHWLPMTWLPTTRSQRFI